MVLGLRGVNFLFCDRGQWEAAHGYDDRFTILLANVMSISLKHEGMKKAPNFPHAFHVSPFNIQ
jgi:hypothetical protein